MEERDKKEGRPFSFQCLQRLVKCDLQPRSLSLPLKTECLDVLPLDPATRHEIRRISTQRTRASKTFVSYKFSSPKNLTAKNGLGFFGTPGISSTTCQRSHRERTHREKDELEEKNKREEMKRDLYQGWPPRERLHLRQHNDAGICELLLCHDL